MYHITYPVWCRFAAGYGHVEVLRWLVQRGCDIDYSPKGGAGPAVLRAARFGHGKHVW